MSANIEGFGRALPEGELTQDRALEMMERLSPSEPRDRRRRAALFGRSGVGRRRSVLLSDEGAVDETFAVGASPGTRARMGLYDEHALPLARRAAIEALENAGAESGSITHLVTVSCTGFGAPGVDLGLIRDLDLSRDVERTHVGFMGCHGALNGLRVARAFVEADPTCRVLLVAVELCSLHLAYDGELRESVPNALFADGAAACVVGGGAGWRVSDCAARCFPDSEDAMTWNVGDRGFVMTLSSEVPDLLRRELSPWLESFLERSGLDVEGVATWAVHPGGPRILDAVDRALGLPEGALQPSRRLLERCGNMSSPTVLFLLAELQERADEGPCVALAFGPGLAGEAALLRDV